MRPCVPGWKYFSPSAWPTIYSRGHFVPEFAFPAPDMATFSAEAVWKYIAILVPLM